MAFNIYKWRRDQLLVENRYYGDITGENSKGVLQAFLNDLKKIENPTSDEIKQIKRIEGEIAKLSENENPSSAITKKLKDITWEDVKGLYVPTSDPDTLQNMDARDIFSDKWREETLENWKEKLRTFFPNADEFEITIDRSNPTWFKTVTVNNDEYNALMAKKSKAKQADIEKSGERLDEIEGDDYYGYNEPINPANYADYVPDPYVNDKIAYIADALSHAWNMGKGNNKINFDDMAEHIIDDLEARFK